MDSLLIGALGVLFAIIAFVISISIINSIVSSLMRKRFEKKFQNQGVFDRAGELGLSGQGKSNSASNRLGRKKNVVESSMITHGGSSIDSASKPINRGDLDSSRFGTGISAHIGSMGSGRNDSCGDSPSDSGGSSGGSSPSSCD